MSKLHETPRARARKAIKVYAFGSSSQLSAEAQGAHTEHRGVITEVLSSGTSDHGTHEF